MTDDTDWRMVIFFYDTGFGMTMGGSLDIKVNRWSAIRPIRVDYDYARLGDPGRHDLRYTAGAVFCLGHR